jgi:hypothetical protein
MPSSLPRECGSAVRSTSAAISRPSAVPSFLPSEGRLVGLVLPLELVHENNPAREVVPAFSHHWRAMNSDRFPEIRGR